MKNFLRAELPCREALFERIARQSFDITCVLRDAIAPEIFAHELDRIVYLQLRPRLSDQCHHTAWLQMRQVPEETSGCACEGARQKPTSPWFRRMRPMPTDSIWTFQIGSR